MQNYKRVLLKESKILDVWFGCWFAVDERCGVWCGLRLTGLGPGLPCLGGPLDEEVMPGATGELLRRVYAGSRTWVGVDTSWKPSISPTTEPELCLADLEMRKYQGVKGFYVHVGFWARAYSMVDDGWLLICTTLGLLPHSKILCPPSTQKKPKQVNRLKS